jgi:hypothetical protein
LRASCDWIGSSCVRSWWVKNLRIARVMGYSSVSTSPEFRLIADASTIINLVATGHASEILAALPQRVTVVDIVPAELESGRQRGWKTLDGLRRLLAEELLDVSSLDSRAMKYFEGLVVGAAADTLDDGEAATIGRTKSYSNLHRAVSGS